MRRNLWMGLILGCLFVLLLEAPAALSSLSDDFQRPYEVLAAPRAHPIEEPVTLLEPAGDDASIQPEPSDQELAERQEDPRDAAGL